MEPSPGISVDSFFLTADGQITSSLFETAIVRLDKDLGHRVDLRIFARRTHQESSAPVTIVVPDEGPITQVRNDIIREAGADLGYTFAQSSEWGSSRPTPIAIPPSRTSASRAWWSASMRSSTRIDRLAAACSEWMVWDPRSMCVCVVRALLIALLLSAFTPDRVRSDEYEIGPGDTVSVVVLGNPPI